MQAKICPVCGKKNSVGTFICSSCSHYLSEDIIEGVIVEGKRFKKCPICGNQDSVTAYLCSNCLEKYPFNAKVYTNENQKSEMGSGTPVSNQQHDRIFTKDVVQGGIILLILLALLFLWNVGRYEGPIECDRQIMGPGDTCVEKFGVTTEYHTYQEMKESQDKGRKIFTFLLQGSIGLIVLSVILWFFAEEGY